MDGIEPGTGRTGAEVGGHAVGPAFAGCGPAGAGGAFIFAWNAGIGLEDPGQPDFIALIDVDGAGQRDGLPAFICINRRLRTLFL